MSARTVCVLARTTGTAPCSRCLGFLDITSGRWRAAEPGHPEHPICDGCAKRDDPQGHATLLAWRRASNGPAVGRKGRS
jgi:hypothetical protein